MAFWRYVQARYTSYQRELAYRHYCADCLRIISENTAKAVESGAYISVRLDDILNPKPKDERTAEDIISAIRNKL